MVAEKLFYKKSDRYKKITVIGLAFFCMVLALVINLYYGIETVYTHFFYLPIILTGLWFKKKTFLLAGFFGITHIVINYLNVGYFEYSTLIRAAIFIIVAAMVSALSLKRDALNEQLAIQEEKFRLINESMLDVIGSVDFSGNIEYVSPSIKNILGYNVDEIENMNLFQIIHPDDKELAKEKFRNAVSKNESINIECRFVRKDGSAVWIESLANPVCYLFKNKKAYVFGCRDISRRKAAEETINELANTDPLT